MHAISYLRKVINSEPVTSFLFLLAKSLARLLAKDVCETFNHYKPAMSHIVTADNISVR